MFQTVLFAATATQVAASCAYGTRLSPRAESGTVEIKDFGYIGELVSLQKYEVPNHTLRLTFEKKKTGPG